MNLAVQYLCGIGAVDNDHIAHVGRERQVPDWADRRKVRGHSLPNPLDPPPAEIDAARIVAHHFDMVQSIYIKVGCWRKFQQWTDFGAEPHKPLLRESSLSHFCHKQQRLQSSNVPFATFPYTIFCAEFFAPVGVGAASYGIPCGSSITSAPNMSSAAIAAAKITNNNLVSRFMLRRGGSGPCGLCMRR